MLFRRLGHSWLVHAPAKVNLFLEVCARRDDGYHELETLMVSVGLYDTLAVADAPDGLVHFECIQPAGAASSIPTGRDNLVVRAAELLRSRYGMERGVRLRLVKRIPAESGLGGGSSDAAATLAVLNRQWNMGLSRPELQSLAAELGSDVPFFLAGSPVALCRGRGERVHPLVVALPASFVIVKPAGGLSTAEVYGRCRPGDRPKSSDDLVAALCRGRWTAAIRCFHNALQLPAESLSPEVRRLRARFSRLPVWGHQLSGSGTAYFGVCATRRQALTVAARLRAERAGRVFVAPCHP